MIMRKTGWWLLPTFFLFALGCGGGGQTTTSGGTTGGGDTALPAGYGLIKLNIHQGSATATAASGPKLLALDSPNLPDATDVRIAARLVSTQEVPVLDDNVTPTGETTLVTAEFYRKFLDIPLPTTAPVSIAVPAANGYTVEVLSSVDGTDSGGNPVHIMLKHGKVEGLNVAAGGTTNATIVANQIIAGLTFGLPDNVIGGNKYSVPVTRTNIPLRGNYYIQQFVDNSANSVPTGIFVDATSSITGLFTAQSLTSLPPGGAGFWNLYFQGLFFIDESWKSETDISFNWWKQWILYYPNPNYGDAPVSIPLYPLGTVAIDVTL